MMEAERLWLKDFPHLSSDKVLRQFLPLLAAAWEAKKATFTANFWEDDITNALIAWMKKAIRAGKLFKGIAWGVYPQIDIFDDGSEGTNKVIGRCDLVLILAQNREYIYECKRLWPDGKKEKFTNSARLYVDKGLTRFLQPSEKQGNFTPQYSSWLGFAGMLGYVMNGNVPEALDAVCAAIKVYAPAQTIQSPCEPPCPSQNACHFLSTHQNCSGRYISMHHVLLSLPATRSDMFSPPISSFGVTGPAFT
jgi:hypothetical protein